MYYTSIDKKPPSFKAVILSAETYIRRKAQKREKKSKVPPLVLSRSADFPKINIE
jgi:hypothetical protein